MKDIPEIYSFCHLAYSQSSILSFGEFTVSSQDGPKQGVVGLDNLLFLNIICNTFITN